MWNTAAYFDDSYLQDGKLHLFAHFERNGAERPTADVTPSIQTPPSVVLNSNTTSGATISCSSKENSATLSRRDSNTIPTRTLKQPLLRAARNRSRIQTRVPDTDSESSDETYRPVSRRDRRTRSLSADSSGLGNAHLSGIDEVVVTLPLPADVSSDQHALDYEAALSTNAAPHEYGYKKNFDRVGAHFHTKIAHARLIKGKYGAPAPSKCARCSEKGLECRIYHPDLKARLANRGSCGECRMFCHPCDLNTTRQEAGEKESHQKKRMSTVPSHELPNKAPRIEAEAENSSKRRDTDLFCPVETCFRHRESFTQRSHVDRHIENVHSNQNISTPNKLQRPKTFVCPSIGCKSVLNRIDNLREHIVKRHSGSLHAQVVEAARTRGLVVRFPNPPSSAQYKADFEAAQQQNAAQDHFGHRLPTEWTRLHPTVKSRIAHAKLIHGKYGTIAPKPCLSCKKRNVTCMVYLPSLGDVGRILGRECGECRNQNSDCDMVPSPFQDIIADGDGVANSEVFGSIDINTRNGARDGRVMSNIGERRVRVEWPLETFDDSDDNEDSSELSIDAKREQPITDQDLTRVVAAPNGDLQISYDAR